MENQDRFASSLPRFSAVAVVITLLAGCANLPTASEAPAPNPLDNYQFRDGSIQHETASGKVAEFWRESEGHRISGNFSDARDSLQQAIELDPRNSILWSRAAELELELSEHLRAENYAAKSNFLSPQSGARLRYRNWLIIQRAREGRGDLLGAREAKIKARDLSL